MLENEELIIKVISGNASVEETDTLLAWRNETPENELYYKKTLLVWEQLNKIKPEFNPNVDEAWNKLSQKIVFKKQVSTKYLKIAAAVLFIIGIGFIGKYVFTSSNIEESNNISINKDDHHKTSKNESHDLREIIKISSEDEPIEEFLQDSSLVILNENTEISYKEFVDNKSRIVFLKGEAFFDVIHKKERFIVSTDYIDVKVVGTAFGVKAVKGDTIFEVFVEEGVVEAYEIKNPKNKIVINSKERCEYHIKTHEFTKLHSKKKHKWWKGFFSKLKKIIDRLKHRKAEKQQDKKDE